MRSILKVPVATGLIIAGAVGVCFWHVNNGLPSDSAIVDYRPPAGQLFFPMKAIPSVVAHAFLAAEDSDFYNHHGVNFPMTLRAMGLDVLFYESGRRPIGASTITQQLVKNLILSDEISFTRKIKEVLLALRVERLLSKDRILEIYLNEIYLGCGSHGVAQAALNYFGKPLTALSIDEAAFLGGLPKAPNHYNPSRYPEAAESRRNWVLDRMVEDNYLARGQAKALKADPVRLGADYCRQSRDSHDANAPVSDARLRFDQAD